ncbi:MAG: hypothetical protein IPK13_17985 [Deltaproteobacteria bacterium]|nr:hypothetical protein [Deltaproteobacteria bacterium]
MKRGLLWVAVGGVCIVAFGSPGCGDVRFGEPLPRDGGSTPDAQPEDAASDAPDVAVSDTSVPGTCIPQPALQYGDWPFGAGSAVYRTVFPEISNCQSCHSNLEALIPPYIPSQVAAEGLYQRAATDLWAVFTETGPAGLSTEGTDHPFWAHASGIAPALTKAETTAMDNFVLYVRSCIIAGTTWQPSCVDDGGGDLGANDANQGDDAGLDAGVGGDPSACYCAPPAPPIAGALTVCSGS